MTNALPVKKRHARNRMSVGARQEQIMASATQLIAERGFWGLTLREVALMCGITEAGILHHYSSKLVLLTAVLEHRDEADFLELSKILGISRADLELDTLPVTLKELCAGLVTRNVRQPEIVRLYTVLNAEALDPSHPAHQYFEGREKSVLDLFRRAAGDVQNPTRIARQVLSAMDGLQLRWLRDQEHLDLVSEWDILINQLYSTT